MGVVERRERQKAEVRQLILDAARTIVLAEGFDALSMRRIADAIEYAPSTIYLHFESRDEIGRELVRTGFSEFLRYFGSAARVADPWERFAEFARLYVQFACEQPEWYRLIFMTKFSDAVQPPAEQRNGDDPGDQAFTLLLGTVAELVESGRARQVEPLLAAELAWAAVHGIVSLRLTCHNMPFADIDKSTEEIIRVLRSGLEQRP